MKNTASIQKNHEMEIKVHGMYGSTVNGIDRGFGTRVHTGGRAKVHPGEAGIVSGHRIRIDTPSRPLLRSIGRFFNLRNILLFLISAIFIGAAVILMLFNFEYSTIYGNTKYSKEQIESFITQGTLGENTFVMAVKYHHRKVTDIPFVDRIDIDIVNPSTVRVNITEKPTDGCIFYKGNNVYISKEGIIQTVSRRSVEETTVINGVVLTHSNTGTPVLAKNQLGLDLSMELIRAAHKYGIRPDSIDVDQKSSLTVSFGDVKVLVGKTGYDEKMYKMHQILPYLDGRSGVISMIGYEDGNTSNENIVLSPSMSEESIQGAEAAQKAQPASEADTEAAAEAAEEETDGTESGEEDAAEEKEKHAEDLNTEKEKQEESGAAGAAAEKAEEAEKAEVPEAAESDSVNKAESPAAEPQENMEPQENTEQKETPEQKESTGKKETPEQKETTEKKEAAEQKEA